ncbi:hypothetical protein [Synechococcus elongatus]|uniref:hypothetical protein n=1 Tax=Synechococcus elongatus TaxID=32046 RepID=UPI000F7F0D5F|nr:hypothetical protein [Synechococcus elongatus]
MATPPPSPLPSGRPRPARPITRSSPAASRSRPSRKPPRRTELPPKPDSVTYRAVACFQGSLAWDQQGETATLQITDNHSLNVALSGLVQATLQRHPQQLQQLMQTPHYWVSWPLQRHKHLQFWLRGWQNQAPTDLQAGRVRICGFVKSWKDQNGAVQVWIGRNEAAPPGQIDKPAWKIKRLQLRGAPEQLRPGWWQFDCEVTRYGQLRIVEAELLVPFRPKPRRRSQPSVATTRSE